MRDLKIFLDDGGVMNNNVVRGQQWQRLIAEYLSPRLGGDPAKWSHANAIVARRVWQSFSTIVEQNPQAPFEPLGREIDRSSVAGLCEMVGVPTPPPGDCIALARETSAYATRRVRAAFPDAIDAIRELHRDGFVLSTASGEVSADLEGYLEGMGVRELFTQALFGPDLVDLPKNSALYYRRIFERAGVDPANALVVDDALEVLDWARSLGARTVLVTTRGPYDGDVHPTIGALRELPSVIESIVT